jgi:CubicO group peptidase (beta-lactamase class C family)
MVSGLSTLAMERVDPESAGLDPTRLDRLCALVQQHVDEGRYLGAQVAMARDGRLALFRSFGMARTDPDPQRATDNTMWLLFSQTKPIVAATVWALVERGLCRFADCIADHVPGFEQHGKGEITLFQVLTHQGGFPNSTVPEGAWTDHDLLRRVVCDFTLEWTPGERVQYHSSSGQWVLAALIEAVTGRDYRDVIGELVLDPLGLTNCFVGVPAEHQRRLAHIHQIEDGRHTLNPDRNRPAFWEAGVPSGGGYANAADMAAFYQMLCHEGAFNGVQVLSPRMLQFVTRNRTDERIDLAMQMPMHRALGVHVRGSSPTIRGLGTIAAPDVFGHGGAGTSYSWADPETGVSFTYLTNTTMTEPAHSVRMDIIGTMSQACVLRL